MGENIENLMIFVDIIKHLPINLKNLEIDLSTNNLG